MRPLDLPLKRTLASIAGKVRRADPPDVNVQRSLACCTGSTWCRGMCTTGGSCRGGQSLWLSLSA